MGYIIAGYTDSYSSNYNDIWLIKTDSEGNKQWDKTFEEKGAEGSFFVHQTSDGGYFITGSTRSSHRSGETCYVWLIKTDSEGNKQWDTTFETMRLDHRYCAQPTSDNGYIFAGWTTSPETLIDGLLIKFDKKGKQTWNKTFGGDDNEWFCSVQQTTDGGYVLAGVSSRNEHNVYVWLVKTDSKGNEQWNKTLGGGSSFANSVRQTTDGGYIVTGNAAFLIKTDGDGNQQWFKTYGDNGASWTWSVQQTFDGGYVFTGLIASEETDDTDFWIVKTDSEGNMVWDRTFGGSDADWAWSVQQTSDGGYIIAGETESYGSGGDDVWLIKLEGTTEKAMKAEVLSPSIDFSVLKDSNVPLKVKVTYEGEPTTGASLTASFSNGDPDVELTEGENGIYTGTWTPTTIIEGQVESPVEITVEAYHGILGRVYAKVEGVIHSGTSPIEVSLREIIEEVEKLRDESISKINRDVDNTATLQAKIGKEVYDKEEKDIVRNSLQHIQGLLMPGSGILDYFMQFAVFELIDNSFKHFDKEIAKKLLNTQSQVDVGCRILHHERDIQDYAMYNTGQENRLVILTEPYESGSHIKNELEIFRYDLHTGIFQFVEKIFRDGVGPNTNLNIETGDLNNDGFEDLLLIGEKYIDVYFYDKDLDEFDISKRAHIDTDAVILDVAVGNLDNGGSTELAILLISDLTIMSIEVYQFDGNQLNRLLEHSLGPHISILAGKPSLAIGDANNDYENELLMSDGLDYVCLFRYDGTELSEISTHILFELWDPIIGIDDLAIGNIDNSKDTKNEIVINVKGILSDCVIPYRYNSDTREFDRLNSAQLEYDVGKVLKLEIRDSTNTGFNNVIAGSKNGIKSYHYEESSEQLEQYLRNEYSDAFMHKDGGPKYHDVIENINAKYDTFANDIKTKDLTNYPTEDVLKYLKELNKNLDSSSDSETSILVMKTAEKTSEIKKIGTVGQISSLVDKTIDDSENDRKSISILGYTIAGGTAVKALLFIKSSGASMIAEAFIYSTTMTGTKYLDQFEKLSLHEKLQYPSLMSLIALSSEVSVTNDAFQNAVDFTLNPTINSIEVIEWPDETCSQGTDLHCGVWLEIDEGDTFGHGTIVVKVKNNGENAARVNLFAEVHDYGDVIAISSSKAFTEISAGEYEVMDIELKVPGIKEWGHNYYSPYRIKIYATSSSSMIGLPWQRSIPLYVDTKQGLDAAKLQMVKAINGQINQGTTIDYPYTTEPSTVQTNYILDYPGSDLDLHIYDSEGHHVGINYGTGKTEIGIQGATYSGPDSIPEYISILNSGDKTYTAKIVAIETTENESYSLITIESPKLPPLVSISPSNITISGSPGEKVNATLTLREYGGFSDLNEISISSSDLTNDVEIDVPSSNVAFRIPSTTIPAGSGITVNLTIDIPKTAEPGKTYLGSIKAIDTSGATDNASFCLTISTPKTIFVDSNFTDNSVSHEWNTITKAILDANSGDTIFVYTGTYRENIILNKELTLTGENKNVTIIDGGVSGKCIHVTADSVIISGFTIQNGTDGVYLYSSDGCNIEGNIIANNGNGISIYNSNNNLIYHNNLIGNDNQAYDNTGTNQWDNGYPSGGNYWSDYTGYDQYSGPNQDIRGSDGIIDAPYSVNAGAQDKYPFMLTDAVVPEVIGNNPRGSSVPVNTPITITFSETMDHESVETAFSTSPSTVGRYSWSGNTMTYAPNSNLEINTMYTVTVGTDSTDLAGNNLQSPYSWQFTTTSLEPTMDIQAEIRNIWTSDIISPIVLFGKNANLGQVLQADLDDDSFSDPLPSYDDRCLGDKNYDKSVISRFGEGDDKVRIVLDITGGTGFKPGSEGYIKILNPEYKITKIYGHSDYVGVQPPTMSLGTPTISTDYSGFGVVIDMEEGSVSWQGRVPVLLVHVERIPSAWNSLLKRYLFPQIQ